MLKRIGLLLLCLFLFPRFSCGGSYVPKPQPDRITFVYELQTEDDIYEVMCSRLIDGEEVSIHGGSHADKTELKGLLEDWIEKDDYPEGDEDFDYSKFGMQLYIRTEPLTDLDPARIFLNTVPVEPLLEFPVEYGHLYTIRIEGSREKGYTATYLGEQTDTE
ncbi:MAG: hypothetical protein IKI59_04795 [Clostridia bacterium]|nr:hypothetical protein [Clostridia bacterium]